jgi:Uma2 family endonuclease
MATQTKSLVDQLYEIDGKAEIVNGKIVRMMATGHLANQAAGEIYVHLRQYGRDVEQGWAYTDNMGFLVDLPNRQSFSPDASFYIGESSGMEFLKGAPIFAAEVRSKNDYGEAAERRMAEKRADYFAAGTETVWDVDLQSEADTVRAFRDGNAEMPAATYGRGETAKAKPALPGFEIPVDDLFE